MRGTHAHAQIATLYLFQVEPQRYNRLLEGQPFRLTLLEETRVIDSYGGLIREQLDDLYVLLDGYLAVQRVIQRQEAQNFPHARAKKRHNQRIFRMPAAGFIVIQRLIYATYQVGQ